MSGESLDILTVAGNDLVGFCQMRMSNIKLATQRRERIERQLLAEHVGKRTQDRPIFAGLARCETGAVAHLNAAFGVDPDTGFFGIGRTRKDDVGVHRAMVTMATDIDGELGALVRQVDFIGAEQEENVHGRYHFGSSNTALARHEADIETTDAGSGGVKHREAVPFFADGANRNGKLCSSSENSRTIGACQSALADDDQRVLGRLQLLNEAVRTVGQIGKRFRARAEIFIIVAQPPASPITPIGKPPRRQRLRMRALSTAAS